MVAALETRTRSLSRLNLFSSWSESCDARDHILGSWTFQCRRDLTISSLIVPTTLENASKAFSVGGCGSLKFSCSLDALTHASDDPGVLRVHRYHLPMRGQTSISLQASRSESINDKLWLCLATSIGPHPAPTVLRRPAVESDYPRVRGILSAYPLLSGSIIETTYGGIVISSFFFFQVRCVHISPA